MERKKKGVLLSSFSPLINRTADRVCGDRGSFEK